MAHFEELSVFSQVSDGKTREVVEDVARFRAVLARLGVGTGASPVPLRLYLFESNRAYDPFKPPAMEKASTGGHFQVSPFGHLMALNVYPNRGSSLPLVYHEYVHEYLHTYYAGLPLWMDEGLAEFYGTFRIEDGEARLGLPQADEIRWLRAHSFIPLSRLFAIDHQSPEYLEGDDRSTFYAESWLLLHYLMVGVPDGGARVGSFRAALAGGAPVDKAFHDSFEMSFAELEGKLRGYLSARVLSYLRMPLADLPTVPPIALADLPPEQALTRLAALQLRAGDAAGLRSAAQLVADAQRLDANFGDAVVMRAALAEQDGREAEARALFDRAASLSLVDPAGWFVIGRSLAARSEAEPGDAAAADRERARAALQKALDAFPNYAEAQALYGLTYLRSSPVRPAEAIPYLEKAARALPGRADLKRLLAQAQAAAGQFEGAKATLGNLPGDGVAAAAVAREERREAINDALTAGRVDDGIRLLREAAAAESDPRYKQFLSEQLAKLEARVAEQRALQAKEQAEIDTFNQAIAAANASRYAQARDMLRQLLSTAQSPNVREAAKKMLAEVEKHAPRK